MVVDTQLMWFVFILLEAWFLDSIYLLIGIVHGILQSLASGFLTTRTNRAGPLSLPLMF